MLVEARDVYYQHKVDVGKTRRKCHVTLKPNVELKRQRPKVPLHLKEKTTHTTGRRRYHP